jgi:hypothetical protein
LTSAVTPVFTFTQSLPVTTGTTHESNAHVKTSHTITSHVVTVPVSTQANSAHVKTSQVDTSGNVGALITHPHKLNTTSIPANMYRFFIILFKI